MTFGIYAKGSTVETQCISCHQAQQIPSHLIYKRYLMKYSNETRIAEAMFRYLKNPQKSNSIMPKPFFLKFPMKEKQILEDTVLKINIKEFMNMFDIKRRLRLAK